jgi:hypothetical protein
MHQPKEPPAPSEDAVEHPLCPCGDPDHEPQRIGETVPVKGAGVGVYSCPETTRYGLGRAS